MKGPLSGRSEASLVSIESGLSSNGSLGSSEGAQSMASRAEGPVGFDAEEGAQAEGTSFAQLVDRHQKRRAQVLGRLAGDVGASAHDVQAMKHKRSKQLTAAALEEEEHFRSPFTLQRVASSRFVDSCKTEVRRLERQYRKLVKNKKPTKALPPEPPYGIKSVGADTDAIFFKWQPPVFDGGANIFDYEIKYVKRHRVQVSANVSKWEQENIGPVSTTMWIQQFPVAHFGTAVAGLGARTQVVDFQVRAVNSYGKSAWSDAFPQARTMDPHVPGPVLHLMLTRLETQAVRFEWQAPLNTGGRRIRACELSLQVEVPDFVAITATGNVAATRTQTETYKMPRWQTHLDVTNLQPGCMVHDVTVVCIDEAKERTMPCEPIDYFQVPTGTLVERLRWEIAHYQGITDGVVDVVRHGVHQRVKRTKHIRVLRSELKRELEKQGLATDSLASSLPFDSIDEEGPAAAGRARLSVEQQARHDLEGLARGDGLSTEQQRILDTKRKQFHKKIDSLVRKRKETEKKVEDLKAERVKQKSTLQLAHKRVSVIRGEVAALAGFKGKFVDSMALHGRMQRFEVAELRRKLKAESDRNESLLAEMKLDIVDGMQEQEQLESQVCELEEKVKEREAALLRFEQESRRAARKAKMLARMENISVAKPFGRWKAFTRNRQEQRHKMRVTMTRMLKRYMFHGFTRWNSQTRKARDAEREYNGRAIRAASRRGKRPGGGGGDDGQTGGHLAPLDRESGSKAAKKLAKELGLPLLAVLGVSGGEPGTGKSGDPLL